MSAKFGARRRQTFLAALAATGNQTLAAERAKVSRSWVTLHRASDVLFRRAIDDAIAVAKARLALRQAQDERPGCKPPTRWGYLDGEELVVKGTGGSGGGKRVQIARSRIKQWSPRVEQRFLATLGATCNVNAACAEVGLTPASAYAHRKRWPGFAERWDGVLEEGYAQLEAELLDAGSNLFSNPGRAQAGPLRGMTVAYAIELLKERRWREQADIVREIRRLSR